MSKVLLRISGQNETAVYYVGKHPYTIYALKAIQDMQLEVGKLSACKLLTYLYRDMKVADLGDRYGLREAKDVLDFVEQFDIQY